MSVPRAGAGEATPPPRNVCPPTLCLPLPHTGGCASPPAAVNRFVGGSAAPPASTGVRGSKRAGQTGGGGQNPSLPGPPQLPFGEQPWAGGRFYKELAGTVVFLFFLMNKLYLLILNRSWSERGRRGCPGAHLEGLPQIPPPAWFPKTRYEPVCWLLLPSKQDLFPRDPCV